MEDATSPVPDPNSMIETFCACADVDASMKGGSKIRLGGGWTYRVIAYAASLKRREASKRRIQDDEFVVHIRVELYQTLPAMPYLRIADSWARKPKFARSKDKPSVRSGLGLDEGWIARFGGKFGSERGLGDI